MGTYLCSEILLAFSSADTGSWLILIEVRFIIAFYVLSQLLVNSFSLFLSYATDE